MSKPKISRPMVFMLGFLAINLIWRVIFLSVSRGAYTDGVLQLTMYQWGVDYWPPLYGLLARVFGIVPGISLETGARLVSLLAGALTIFPIAAIARRLFGLRAAIWAMMVWTVSPLALRWSMAVMTDSLFTCLFIGALALLLMGIEQYLPGMFPQEGVTPQANPKKGSQLLILAGVVAAMATLTRHQGILLLPPMIAAVWWLSNMAKHMPTKGITPWASLAPWLAAFIWFVKGLMAHFHQFSERANVGGVETTLGAKFVQYLWELESFLSATPYFLGWGLFIFLMFGLYRTNWATQRIRWAGATFLYLALAIYLMQTAFMAFQFRYFLPLVPLVAVFAGHGFATWERKSEKQPLKQWLVVGPPLVHALLLGAIITAFQSSPFLEIKKAANYLNDQEFIGDEVIFSNEIFNYKIPEPVKLSFWIKDDELSQRVESLPRSTDPILAAGDRIVLSSFYEGIPSNFTRRVAALQNSFPITLEAQFEHSFFPIFPDLVQDTRWHTNPEGWIRRYQKQHFRCYVLKVDAVAKPDETEALRQELEDLMREGASGPANKDDETTDTQETQ